MLDLLISLGLWGCIKQSRDAISLKLDDLVLRNRTLKCPICLSRQIWKDGHERRKNRCPVQRFTCQDCKKDFCVNTFAPWYRHKYSPPSIILFLWLFLQGESILSCTKKCSFSERFPTWKTLWSWLQKFKEILFLNYSKNKPKVSRHRAWQTDEVYFRRRPVIGTVDPQTNTILLTTSWRANSPSIYKHFKRVTQRWKKKPRSLWSDEWQAYPKAIRLLDETIPHKTVKHRDWQFKKGHTTTNAIENVWRQYRRWMFRKNGVKHQYYVDDYTKFYEMKHNILNSPLVLVQTILS